MKLKHESKNLVVVVHATTIENIKGIHQGWEIEGAISEQGKSEMKLTGDALKEESFELALSSPLNRCLVTCKELAKYHPGLEIIITDGLRAKRSGIYCGKPRELVHEVLIQQSLPIYLYRPEDGESTVELQQRVVDFFFNYIPTLPHKQILIVTHGGVITTFGLYLNHRPFDDYDHLKPAKCSVTRIKYYNEKFTILDWDNITHLK